MTKNSLQKLLLTIAVMLFTVDNAFTCSMYKLTVNGKTMVGNNEDSWRLTSRIWFERGTNGNYGVAYVGYSDKVFADGAVNEFGLAWDGLVVPTRVLKDQGSKKYKADINTMKMVMQKCKAVDEVYLMLQQYNLSSLNGSMFLFIDKTGEYLVLEADTMIRGNDQKYVLANFCPSQTPDLNSIKMEGYRNGVEFLKNKIDTSISFCKALSDTMSVCRGTMGDGTLYTSIYDLHEGFIYLYFYHDFKHEVKFNIKEELAKGNHFLDIPSLFPTNKEYEKFKSYKIPQNSKSVLLFLTFCKGLFLFSALFFLSNFIRNRKKLVDLKQAYAYTNLVLFVVSIILLYYIIVLIKNVAIFYFPAPYKDYKFTMLNIAAYIPFFMLLMFVPLAMINYRLFKNNSWSIFPKTLYTLNNITYLTLMILFSYWGLYNIF